MADWCILCQAPSEGEETCCRVPHSTPSAHVMHKNEWTCKQLGHVSDALPAYESRLGEPSVRMPPFRCTLPRAPNAVAHARARNVTARLFTGKIACSFSYTFLGYVYLLLHPRRPVHRTLTHFMPLARWRLAMAQVVSASMARAMFRNRARQGDVGASQAGRCSDNV